MEEIDVFDKLPWADVSKVPDYFYVNNLTAIKCRVHPLVIFTILDAYLRREEGHQQVIGTLLGVVYDSGCVEVTDCFVDRYTLTSEGFLQIVKEHHEGVFELAQKINPKEQVVGWFCTGSKLTELTCAVHGWFKQFSSVSKFFPHSSLPEPIHLLVDAVMDTGHIAIKVYVQLPVAIVKDVCFHFHEIALEIQKSSPNSSAIAEMLRALDHNRDITKKPFYDALDKMELLIDKCCDYVKDVLEEKVEPNEEVGRYLTNVTSYALVDMEDMDNVCEGVLQDNLIISSLSNLANLQFKLAERLNTTF
ncbi:Eukaryotic translation initiation factor 3 subunit F [Babesia microti strain RI]|uniref:Eukaryotic translation initiation factor 3 subunit F n=1 Tax=Babesia microti (strain RI) TaxID=1133968 RepID=I7IQA7_BABMR|nr:Eukaryotic translation initiation factor 3 subunit F [Babesia microti strain RI]CCF73630.1 Eukaryotic translation initiation factor 3 subunit F [Babesia microti strain RI]|eukprot:XP_012648239.1 Eukaryotic translation initiation factor 3 subunit F [Babesia microti strain RI]